MYRAAKTIRSNKLSAKSPAFKILALALCLAYIFVSLTGPAYILLHLDHEHDHHGPDGRCSVCVQIAAAGNILKLFSAAEIVAVVAIGTLPGLILLRRIVFSPIVFYTPVTLKVKLNN
ncbi:MAG: hypothetical protein RBT41_11390 [Clostridia bacterium]|jgi:hypothetical protein|nr:hypothetical protein [Clostridia bacterium]